MAVADLPPRPGVPVAIGWRADNCAVEEDEEDLWAAAYGGEEMDDEEQDLLGVLWYENPHIN